MEDQNTQRHSLGRRKSSLKNLSLKLRSGSRRAEESVAEEQVVGDGALCPAPQLKMPNFAPFDSTTASTATPAPLSPQSSQPEVDTEAPSPQTTQATQPPPSLGGTLHEQPQPLLSPKPSTNNMSTTTTTTTTIVESSPIQASDNTPWIGGTGLGSSNLGKSGRVIEKLMAENDRLRREMKAEIAKREELQRTAQAQKPRLEALQAENARLSHCKAVDESVIKRRDRKIQDLKAELDIERQKRESLEGRVQEAERKMGEYEEHSNKEVQQAIEQAKHATTHASILETSHRQLSSEYRQRIASVTKQVQQLADEKQDARKALVRLDVVNHQMRQESEKSRKLYTELSSLWEKFKLEKNAEVEGVVREVRELRQGAEDKGALIETTLEEMTEVMNRMKWCMAVQKVASENGQGISSPPPSPPF